MPATEHENNNTAPAPARKTIEHPGRRHRQAAEPDSQSERAEHGRWHARQPTPRWPGSQSAGDHGCCEVRQGQDQQADPEGMQHHGDLRAHSPETHAPHPADRSRPGLRSQPRQENTEPTQCDMLEMEPSQDHFPKFEQLAVYPTPSNPHSLGGHEPQFCLPIPIAGHPKAPDNGPGPRKTATRTWRAPRSLP